MVKTGAEQEAAPARSGRPYVVLSCLGVPHPGSWEFAEMKASTAQIVGFWRVEQVPFSNRQ